MLKQDKRYDRVKL